MSVPYERTGRVNQKARTRDALIKAARDLLSQGVTPTVEKVADEASVSRTTGYRYFADRWALVAAAFPHVEEQSILGPDAPEDAAGRLTIVATDQTRLILTHEQEMRAAMRLSLDGVRPPELPMHRELRVRWVEDALQPLRGRIAEERFMRLVYGICATLGIEAFAWLTDIAGLKREEAASVMRTNAMGLLESATPPGRAE